MSYVDSHCVSYTLGCAYSSSHLILDLNFIMLVLVNWSPFMMNPYLMLSRDNPRIVVFELILL